MKRISMRKKLTSVLMAAVMCLFLLPALDARAAAPKEYTVTFRAGNVGKFLFREDVPIEGLYGTIVFATPEAIKFKVEKGESVPNAYPYVQADEGYFVKNWGPGQGQIVDRNLDFVVDYGKLVDGVEYTVRYVDASTGESIAAPYTAYANIGDEISPVAPATLTTSDNGVYHLQGSASAQLTLSDDAGKNVVEFKYVNDYNPGSEVQEIVNYEDGGVTTVTDTVTVPGQGGTPAPGAAVVGGGDDAAGGGGAPAPAPENDNVVEIDDNEVPLADGMEQEEQHGSEADHDTDSNVVVIEDTEVPLNGSLGNSEIMIAVVAAVVGVAALMTVIIWLRMRKRKQ